MRPDAYAHLEALLQQLPQLQPCRGAIESACEAMLACARRRGRLLVCGNGGSAADAEHLVGELMNRFLLRRPADTRICERLCAEGGSEGEHIASLLQGAVAAVSLVSQCALVSAIANDCSADMVYAQQVYGYGAAGDVLLAISTSGNARNVLYAARVARALDMHVIGLSGASGGALAALCHSAILVAEQVTFRIQQLHVPIYHAICGAVEQELFGS